MHKTITINRNLVNFLIPFSLLGILVLLMQPAFLTQSDHLSLAITIDLLITVPAIYYLLIRKSSIPKTTTVPIMVLGFLVGTYFLPIEDQAYLQLFKTWAFPLIELSVLSFVVLKVRKAIKIYKEAKGNAPDFFSTLKEACHEILPQKLVLPFTTEVAVMYYGFINWKRRALHHNEFSYHKKSGSPALFGALILILVVETFALHLLLGLWSETVAWICSLLSIYTIIQLLGFSKSLSQRPIAITQNSLLLRYGILNETTIPITAIKSIECSRQALEKDELTQKLSLLGDLESHNVIIHLHNTNELTGLYGRRKPFRTIGLHVDSPDEFKEKVENALQTTGTVSLSHQNPTPSPPNTDE